jgi:uncharacterized membrane protein YeiH
MIHFLQYASLAAAAISGALAARGRHIDLFGVLVISMVTAFGGGTVRDLCLDAPVFWLSDYWHVLVSLGGALITFFWAQRQDPPASLLEYFDAVGLAIYAVLGAQKALAMGTTPLAVVALGTMTGVAGGIVRDVLLNEVPLVFRRDTRLYATAAAVGCAVFLLLHWLSLPDPLPLLAGSAVVLAMRFTAIHFAISLPEFEDRRSAENSDNPS